MARDYAQRGGSNRRQTRSSSKGAGLPAWVWMFAGLSIGLAVAAFIYISRPASRMPGAATEDGAAVAVKPEKNANKKDPLLLPPREKPRFTFYELLPNQEVVVPRDEALKAAAGKPASGMEAGAIYFIQVASYRAASDAEKQKASLALLGAEARIEKVTIDNKDTYYRVRIGPEKDLAHAQSLMARLEENGIQSLLVKVKN